MPETAECAVLVNQSLLHLPTYEPLPPDKNPMFLEKRVYQGSSGKVYPLPFYDRIAERPTDRAWKAIRLENEYLSVTILPEIGGRIHAMRDKVRGYDVIYDQPIIKPALVGLAGPWASGGIEFNWPQHHRPATFMPVDSHVEREADGSVTVWLSDHDPLARMKGMHGVRLRPGSSALELRVRLYNRTPYTQTFLWWANVATKVHELYQSFFPPDVSYVADHAKRSMSRYPLCDDQYYGVPYAERARTGVPLKEMPAQFVPPKGRYEANDLSWYANIPVPTSYMCMGTNEDFFGGYDHRARAGIVHIADHHVAPGKKQWTWGNHEFGYAWDRNLTDADAGGMFHPYIELMAGVFTDNQPDFTFLAPGETKTFSQFWYPIHEIGPANQANMDAAVSLRVDGGTVRVDGGTVRVGVCSTRVLEKARITISAGDMLATFDVRLAPGDPFVSEIALPVGVDAGRLHLRVCDVDGHEVISFENRLHVPSPVPAPATEPPLPQDVPSIDELYVIGTHLAQYRHATRDPESYWREALRRDSHDSRCNTAIGNAFLKRGEFKTAVEHFSRAIERVTSRNPNPVDGEAHYAMGLALRFLGDDAGAYDALMKASWSQAWKSASLHAASEIDAALGNWATALIHIDDSLRLNVENLRARNLKVIILRRLGREEDADRLLKENLALDPLDWWARDLLGQVLECDLQTSVDIAIDYARCGRLEDAYRVVKHAAAFHPTDVTPLVHYYLGGYASQLDDTVSAERHLSHAGAAHLTGALPYRLEDFVVLTRAPQASAAHARVPYLLGCLLYDRKRYAEAISQWESATNLDPSFPTAWRNLGIAYFNVRHSPERSRAAYDRALACDPSDARIIFERDQLWKRLGVAPRERLAELEKHASSVGSRDDLSVEYCALLNQTGRHTESRALLAGRHFQPWEGGEGQTLGQHVRTHLMLGRQALREGDAQAACELFRAALASPKNLGEARHLLANQSDIHFYLGLALRAAGREAEAVEHLTTAADFRGDFQLMSVRPFSEMTYFSALAARELGRSGDADELITGLLAYTIELRGVQAKIDYFATSLPTMLLFDDDLQARQDTHSKLLEAQARLGMGDTLQGRELLGEVLKRDPSHALAADLLEEVPEAANYD